VAELGDFMEKILVAVRKISDLKNPEIGNYFECTSCGGHLFYCEDTDENGWTFNCSNCGKVYTHL
jgi:predicted RNA-binding Zn-ribbon protein involved in translation (DUF1610 family)